VVLRAVAVERRESYSGGKRRASALAASMDERERVKDSLPKASQANREVQPRLVDLHLAKPRRPADQALRRRMSIFPSDAHKDFGGLQFLDRQTGCLEERYEKALSCRGTGVRRWEDEGAEKSGRREEGEERRRCWMMKCGLSDSRGEQ
jgi:hypothetical protein